MNKTKFIDNVVLGWIKGDLERMRDTIRPDKSEAGNINFPLALSTLSCMEYLGGFLTGEEGDFTRNVEKYINECFKHPDMYPVDILKDLIRNGLAHDYFPRGAISRNNKRPVIYKGRTSNIVLDAETLVNDFITSLEVFVDKLEDGKYESRMKEALEKNDKFKVRYKDFIENLEGQPDDDDQATPSRGPSGSINTTTTDPSIK